MLLKITAWRRGTICLAGLTLASALPLAGLAQGQSGANGNQAAPRKIVSLNLCADQYLLALADRGQIAGLTHNAGQALITGMEWELAGLRKPGRGPVAAYYQRRGFLTGRAL